MSEPLSSPAPSLTAWGLDLDVAVCEYCHWRYLVPTDGPAPLCPNCFKAQLVALPDGLPEMPHPYPPELFVPFSLSEDALDMAIHHFADGIPFAPPGLTQPGIRSHLVQLFLPMWLVDGVARAYWQAETGFNYQVVSHEEVYNGDLNRWQSREVKEPRIRWANRTGRLSRAYQNIPVPAIDDSTHLEKQIGPHIFDSARSYDPECMHKALVRLPDHPPQEDWNEAASAFQKTASEECRQACAADHMRQFRWQAQFNRLNWTLMLLPVYAASYLDDQGKPQPILIHGQTGNIAGSRRASLKRAGRFSLSIFLFSLLFFISGLLLNLFSASLPVLSTISIYLLMIGLAGFLASAVPFVIAWDFNRRQVLEQARV
jgi:hypothetical protein